MRTAIISFIIIFLHVRLFSQEKDTTILLENIIVRGYNSYKTDLSTPANIGRLGKRDLERIGMVSLVPVVNSIPGIRMEERSPGSYRFSIRGSLLRSPFGVRNIKIYWKDMPITDAGGNTYLNLLDLNGIGAVEILKGPGSSIFGAGTGGVVTFQEPKLYAFEKNQYTFQTGFGSYGTFNAMFQAKGKTKNAQWHIMQSHVNSDGYRENSSMRRDVTQANLSWSLSSKNQLDALIIFSNLGYRTPGGLTYTQMQQNPRMSRPASGSLPSALQQKAGIYNTTFISGLTDSFRLGKYWSNISSVVLTNTDFRNPFLSNYEKRNEWNFSFRTAFRFEKKYSNNQISWTSGIETQSGFYRIDSSGNVNGIADHNTVRDLVSSNTRFIFSHFELSIKKQWVFQAGVSVNEFGTSIQRQAPLSEIKQVKFEPKLMPRLAILYLINAKMSIYGSLNRGYSTPTIAEIKPSASGIYNGLQAELGYSKEIGFKSNWFSNKLKWVISVFNFNLQDAIVRRTNDAGQEYFVNAGGTIQKGLESNVVAILFSSNHSNLKEIRFANSITLNDFRFQNYIIGETNYSNNKITGVPDRTIYTTLDFECNNGIYGLVSMNYNSSLPLNDKNDTFTDPFYLWQSKLGYKLSWRSGFFTDIYVLVDNIGDATYSLGNDINAFGKRFFNPAPGRNYSIGIKIHL